MPMLPLVGADDGALPAAGNGDEVDDHGGEGGVGRVGEGPVEVGGGEGEGPVADEGVEGEGPVPPLVDDDGVGDGHDADAPALAILDVGAVVAAPELIVIAAPAAGVAAHPGADLGVGGLAGAILLPVANPREKLMLVDLDWLTPPMQLKGLLHPKFKFAEKRWLNRHSRSNSDADFAFWVVHLCQLGYSLLARDWRPWQWSLRLHCVQFGRKECN